MAPNGETGDTEVERHKRTASISAEHPQYLRVAAEPRFREVKKKETKPRKKTTLPRSSKEDKAEEDVDVAEKLRRRQSRGRRGGCREVQKKTKPGRRGGRREVQKEVKTWKKRTLLRSSLLKSGS